MKHLLYVLEKSLEKNGDRNITLSHLINLIKFAEKLESKENQYLDELVIECTNPND